MIPISNEDARIIQVLLERGYAFHRNHATARKHRNDGIRMRQLSDKLRRKINNVNRAAATPRPQTKKQQ
jgi:hypothetical protein